MLSLEKIPQSLHSLSDLAQRFGVTDDLLRERAVLAAPSADVEQLINAVAANEAALDDWLAGSEANGPGFSDEYIAFSAMRMASDFACAGRRKV